MLFELTFIFFLFCQNIFIGYCGDGGDFLSINATPSIEKPPPIANNDMNSNSSIHLMNELLVKVQTNYKKETLPSRPLVIHLDTLLLKVKSTVEKEGIFESVIALFIASEI